MKDKSQVFRNILNAFNNNKIKYCLLRVENDELLSNDTELDILIWPESFKHADMILRQNKFVCWKDRKFLKKLVYAHYQDGVLWLLDVHLAFVQDGIIYMDLQGVEARLRTTQNGYKILSKEDQLLHYFFHNLLGKGHIQTKHFDIVKKLISDEINQNYMFNRIYDDVIKKIFQGFLKNPSDFKQVSKQTLLAQETIKNQLLKKTFSNRVRFFFKKYLFNKVYRNRGVHFAIMGVDGAGKSSLIEVLKHNLNTIKGIQYTTVYMGPWGHSKSPWHKWILKNKITLPKSLNKDTAGIKKVLGKFKAFLKGTIYYLSIYTELWYRYLKFIRPELKKGRIILSDRYIYDLRYIYKKRKVVGFKFIRFFICQFFPKPDKIIFLYNDPEVIIKRKPQLNKEQIREYQEYYFKALNRYKTIAINTNDEPPVIAKYVLEELFKSLLTNSNLKSNKKLVKYEGGEP